MPETLIECCRCGKIDKKRYSQLPDGWSEFHITTLFGQEKGTEIKYKCNKCNFSKSSEEVKSERKKVSGKNCGKYS